MSLPNLDEITRRLAALDPDRKLKEPDPEPTAAEIQEHYHAMRAEHQSPARIAWVHARLAILCEQGEIGLYNYRRFFAGGREWSIEDGQETAE